jgi:hypothetical protein
VAGVGRRERGRRHGLTHGITRVREGGARIFGPDGTTARRNAFQDMALPLAAGRAGV